MSIWHVVLFSSLTVLIIFLVLAMIYFSKTKNVMVKSEERGESLINSLKPGDKVLFASGLIGTFVRIKDKDVSAIIKLHDNSEVEVALYSISNIIK